MCISVSLSFLGFTETIVFLINVSGQIWENFGHSFIAKYPTLPSPFETQFIYVLILLRLFHQLLRLYSLFLHFFQFSLHSGYFLLFSFQVQWPCILPSIICWQTHLVNFSCQVLYLSVLGCPFKNFHILIYFFYLFTHYDRLFQLSWTFLLHLL